MKKRLLNNYGLKLLSIVCAILFWGIIVNVNDPSDKASITGIPVTLVNTSLLTDNGYIYEVEGNTNIVAIEVKGPRSVVENLRASDFKAEAEITNEFSDTADIEVKCINSNIDTDDITITLKSDVVKLDIQNLVTKTFDVVAEVEGNPATGYYTDASLISISPTTIRVSGPENVIEQIAKVKVTYDATGETADINETVKPLLYTENDRLVNTSKLTFSKDDIAYRLDILEKKVVDINFAVSGTVAEDCRYMGLTSTLEQVTIAGREEDLKDISSIDIPASLLNISGLSGDKDFTVLVSQYVPNNVYMISEENTAQVTVSVEQLLTKTVSLTNDKIKVENLSSDYRMEFLNRTLNSVVVKGTKDELEGFNSESLKATIDLTGLKPGEHTLVINITTEGETEIIGTYRVDVRIIDESLSGFSEIGESEFEG